MTHDMKSNSMGKPFRDHTLLLLLASVFLGTLLAGCANDAIETSSPEQTAQLPGADYLIAPGDTLAVFVWAEPDLSIVNVPVRPDGKITTPLAEDIVAAGKTASGLAREIEQELRAYIRKPVVTVSVTDFVGLYSKQVRVVGAAVEPQSIPYRDGMSVLDVVIAIGGLTEFANGNKAILIRNVDGTEKRYRVRLDDLINRGRISENIQVLPGDVLIIPEGRLF
ncbi:XrtA/PEP-CTERM system exopolysaccharide export protein [Thiococcus pfennigii]|jgi:polysaccharide export outer membrane protein|uniref:XrtA/PEP-CTERM system exopolysaccharide export protein n=1 Tax=Thiococcus pfennigii TaxID=1057 RepID=UPI001F5B1397|nr:XrtA/PEP-CTERM system exopolysaccharide export protein [Thiococcus pfennigii]